MFKNKNLFLYFFLFISCLFTSFSFGIKDIYAFDAVGNPSFDQSFDCNSLFINSQISGYQYGQYPWQIYSLSGALLVNYWASAGSGPFNCFKIFNNFNISFAKIYSFRGYNYRMSPYYDNIPGNFYLLISDSGSLSLSYSTIFINKNIIIIGDGTNLKYYELKSTGNIYGKWNNDRTIWTDYEPFFTTSYLTGFISPDINRGEPVFVTGIGSGKRNGWYYIGTDNKSHFLEENNKFIDNVILDGQELLPLGTFPTKLSNTNILFANRNPSYSSVLTYLNSSGDWQKKDGVETGTTLQRITTFENPNLFFQKSDGNIVKWNLNCLTPGYTSTEYSEVTNKWYCTDGNGNKSPNNEDPNIEVVPPSNDSTSTGSTDGDFSITGFTGGIYTYNIKPQNCTPVYFSGVTTSSSGNQSFNNPNECAWLNVGGNFRCQDYSGNACKSVGDMCTKEYTQETINSFSGTQQYSGDITKYNCSTSKYSCKWLDKNICSPSDYCYTPDNVYCKVKPDKEDISIVDENNTEVSDNKIKIPSISDPFNSFVGLDKGGFTGGIVGNTGTGYNNIAESSTNSGYCEMFNGSSFIYYSNGPGFSFNLNLSGFTTNKYIKDYFLVWIDKFFNILLSPINNTLSIIRTFLPVSDNTKVCFFGTIQIIKYQKILNVGSNRVHFDYKINNGEMTYFDYIFLFGYGLFALFFIIGLLGFGRLNLSNTPDFGSATSSNIKTPITRTSRRQTYSDIYGK